MPVPSPADPRHSLEAPGPRSEHRWSLLWLGLLGALVLYTAWTARRVAAEVKLAPAPAVDHGPLPDSVRQEVLSLVAPHLEGARLEEIRTGAVREFRISGKPKELLAQEFYGAFRPLVASRLMPLLRPYGEIISFDIQSLDLPPARLRDIPERSDLAIPESGPHSRLAIGSRRQLMSANRKSAIENRQYFSVKDS